MTQCPEEVRHTAEPREREQLDEYRFRVGCRFPALRELLVLMPVEYRKRMRWEDYVHTLIHRLCGHMTMPDGMYPAVWNLACDMSAEYIRTLMFPDSKSANLQLDVKAALTEGGDPWRAEDLYRALMNLYTDELDELSWQYTRDDHRSWRKEAGDVKLRAEGSASLKDIREQDQNAREQALVHEMLVKMWMPLLEALTEGGGDSGRWGLTSGSAEERALLRVRNQLDFTRYLRRFSVFGEETMLDDDSFDQIPYYYGLELYGNLPMIEPLEYADCFRVEDLIIAIDTSGSCSVELVQEFLGEIRHILMDHDAFFRRMNVHIIQCDAYIRDHVVIRSREDWDRYSREIDIKGRRGTDFRPVFRLADQMMKEREFKKLKGVFYFTDGDGIYPEWKPEYETAFVFSTLEALDRPGIPDWVTKLCMELPDLK